MKWLKDKLGQAHISRALENAEEEALFEQAALEVSKGDIRPGLWAKAIAAADGDELKAKARYLGFRVEQLQLQRDAVVEISRMNSSANPETVKVQESYDAVDGKCPNEYCSAIISLSDLACPKCDSQFGEGAAWKVLRIKTT